MPLFTDPRWRALVILSVYGYQGLVAGFAVTALPNWRAAGGASLGEIGAYLALAGVPWTLQPLWGPVVDSLGMFRMGRRRFWVVAGLCGALACLALLALLADGPLHVLALLLLLHNACASLVDTAMDGQIIDGVPAERLGQATALTRVGFATGTAAGATLFGWALPALGPTEAAALLLGIATMAVLAPLVVRERPGDDLLSLRRRATLRAEGGFLRLLAALGAFARQRDALLLLLLCVTEEFVVGAFGLRLSVAMVQEGGWTSEALSRFQGVLILLAGTVGALAVAAWVDRTGPARAFLILLGTMAACYAVVAWLVAGEATPMRQALALGLSNVSPALVFVALAPAVMLDSRGDAAATRFALFMAALNFGGIGGAAAAGAVGEALAPWEMAAIAAAILAACTALVASPLIVLGRRPMPPAPPPA